MKYYLIGMPGCGKTTIGKVLSERLKCSYIDLDQYIEQRSCLFIDEIFEQYGEQYFRDLESNCLIELKETTNIVISCGGGIVVKECNKIHMNGTIIYLETPIEILEKRLSMESGNRPLLKNNSLEELFNKRKEKYELFADITVQKEDINECIDEIMKRISYEENISS